MSDSTQGGEGPPPLPASLLGWLSRGGAAAIVAAIDHLLEQNDWARARLAPHAGRSVRIGLDVPAFPGLPEPRIIATITGDGRLEASADADGKPPSVTMLFEPSVEAAFDFGRSGIRGLSRHLRLEGEVHLAAALGEIYQHLRWDAVEDLSHITGDVAAERIARAATGGFGALRDAGTRVQATAARYLAIESGQLVDRAALESFSAVLDSIERRVDSLSARIPSSR